MTLLASTLVVGVTGHRNLRAADVPALHGQVRAFFLDLRARYPALPISVLSSLAEGSDQLVAQVALELGLHVVAPLPVAPELYRDDFEHSATRALFERQLAQVSPLYLPIAPGNDPQAVSRQGPERDQ